MATGYTCVNDWTETGTRDVWTNWVNESSFSITNSTTSPTDAVWKIWARDSWTSDCITTTGTTCTDTAWQAWVRMPPTIMIRHPQPVQPLPPPLTAEEKRAIRQAERQETERWKKIAEEEKALRIAAEARAEKLLLEHLSEPQRQQYRKEKKFRLVTRSGKEYEVAKGWAGNVVLIERGTPVERYCIHPTTPVPEADNLLAQKLMLETNEPEFLRIANATRLRAA